MNGAFPPNSSESFLIVSALCFIKVRPTSVEPVKVNLRTSGLEVISPPISLELPVTTLKTPAGTPARSANTAKANAEKGVGLGRVGGARRRSGWSFQCGDRKFERNWR